MILSQKQITASYYTSLGNTGAGTDFGMKFATHNSGSPKSSGYNVIMPVPSINVFS
jgi:hypothetical protein